MKRLKILRSIRYIYYEFITKCDISIKDRDKIGKERVVKVVFSDFRTKSINLVSKSIDTLLINCNIF